MEELTTDDLRVLYELLRYHYIDYENVRAHEVVDKLSWLVKDQNEYNKQRSMEIDILSATIKGEEPSK